MIVDDTHFNLVVAVAAERSYDLIFMDQRMPEIDGTEALLH